MLDPTTGFFKCIHFPAKPVDLSPTGYSRFYPMAVGVLFDRLMIEAVTRLHRNGMRTRADYGHFTAKHIEQLGQLIKAELPEHAADTGYSRVVLQRPQRPRMIASILIHCTELEDTDHVVIE